MSDGTTGPEWVPRLEGQGYVLTPDAKQLLLSDRFIPTSGKVTHCVAIKGEFFSDDERTTANVRTEAAHRKMVVIDDLEVGCLLREKFSNEDLEDMGLWWLVVMFSGGVLDLLAVSRSGDGRKLDAYCAGPDDRWLDDYGFVFSVPSSRA